MMGAIRFHWTDAGALPFFREHGYVVLHGVLGEPDLATIEEGWSEVVVEAASRVGFTPEHFVERFPQNRDLWRKSAGFRRLLMESRQGEVARTFLDVTGVRLFHDHAICKPATVSGIIPWHQDSAYWPLDRVGLSLWTPTGDVPADGGCLEVLCGSHRDGPGEPQDFLACAGNARRDTDPRLVRLTVSRGDTVVLDGLTWHGSGPNRSPQDRLAYLTLWVPATARFRPEHAAWHPTVSHINVCPGARLDGDWFPLFGEVTEADEGRLVEFPTPSLQPGPSMFTAGRDIAAQLRWLRGTATATISELLTEDGVEQIVGLAVAGGFAASACEAELREVLCDLALNEMVRRESVARDVYLEVVGRWWRIAGGALAEAMND